MKINRFKAIALGLTTLVGGAIGAQAQTNQAAELDVEFALTNSQPIISVAAPLVNLSGGNIITDTNGALAASGFLVDLGTPVITVDGSGKIAGVTFATVTETDPKTTDSITSQQVVNITGNLGDKGSTPTITLSLAGKGVAENGLTDANGNFIGGKATLSLKFSGSLSTSAGVSTCQTNCTTNVVFAAVTNFSELANTNLLLFTNANLAPFITTNVATNYLATSETYTAGPTNNFVLLTTAMVTNTSAAWFAQTTTVTNICTNSVPGTNVTTATNCANYTDTNYAAVTSTNGVTNLFTSTNFVVVTNYSTNLFLVTSGGTNYLATNETFTAGPTNNFVLLTTTVVTNGSNAFFAQTTTVTNICTNSVPGTNVATATNCANYTDTNYAAVTSTNGVTNLFTSTAIQVLTVTNLNTNSGFVFFATNSDGSVVSNNSPLFVETETVTNCTPTNCTVASGGAAIEGVWTGSFKPGIKKESTINLSKKPAVSGEIGSPSLGEGTEIDVNTSIAALLASNAKSVTFVDAGLIMPIDATLGTAFDSLAGTGSGSGKGGSKPSFSLSIAGSVLNSKGSSIMIKGTLGDNPLNVATANGGLGADPATVFLNVSATGKVLGQKVKVTAGNGAAEIPVTGPPFPAAGF